MNNGKQRVEYEDFFAYRGSMEVNSGDRLRVRTQSFSYMEMKVVISTGCIDWMWDNNRLRTWLRNSLGASDVRTLFASVDHVCQAPLK